MADTERSQVRGRQDEHGKNEVNFHSTSRLSAEITHVPLPRKNSHDNESMVADTKRGGTKALLSITEGCIPCVSISLSG
eukprot:766752-Hanusia_phi.AAC.17